MNQQALVNQGNLVRNNYNHYGCFQRQLVGPVSRRLAGGRLGHRGGRSGYPTWGAALRFCGYPAEPVYYDYGSNVVYEGDTVYINGDSVGTQEQYASRPSPSPTRASRPRRAKEEEWLSLGVFAMVQGERTDSNDLFQLAVNKAGTIRGNYYNALGDTTLPVYGSVDKKTQRAAWTVGDRKEPIYEAGFANLTKSETTMLVHLGKEPRPAVDPDPHRTTRREGLKSGPAWAVRHSAVGGTSE